VRAVSFDPTACCLSTSGSVADRSQLAIQKQRDEEPALCLPALVFAFIPATFAASCCAVIRYNRDYADAESFASGPQRPKLVWAGPVERAGAATAPRCTPCVPESARLVLCPWASMTVPTSLPGRAARSRPRAAAARNHTMRGDSRVQGVDVPQDRGLAASAPQSGAARPDGPHQVAFRATSGQSVRFEEIARASRRAQGGEGGKGRRAAGFMR